MLTTIIRMYNMRQNMDLAKFSYDFKINNKTGECVTVPTLKPTTELSSRAMKKMHKLTATIEIDGVKFAADETSISFMTSILALANFKYNQAVGSGIKPDDAYAAVYSQEIDWKDIKNNWVKVKLSSIGDNLEQAMHNLAAILAKY